MGKAMTVFGSTYVKITFGAVMAFAGIVGGMYVGKVVTEQRKTPRIVDLSKASPSPYLRFVAGDLFPLEEFTDREGKRGNFEQLLKDKDCVVIFVNLDCPPCHNLLKYRKDEMKASLRPNVQVVVCLEKSAKEFPSEYAGLVKDVSVVFYDGPHWRSAYHMDYWPTIVGVDNSGFVRHVQLGFDDAIDHEIVQYFYKSNR